MGASRGLISGPQALGAPRATVPHAAPQSLPLDRLLRGARTRAPATPDDRAAGISGQLSRRPGYALERPGMLSDTHAKSGGSAHNPLIDSFNALS
jgi:hypothetical protein